VTERSNIVLLISHDTGRFISPYGVDTVHTPNFERRFEKSPVHRVPADALNGGASQELGHLQRQGMEELFDLEVDPHEQQDLSGDPAYATVCKEMRARLVAGMRETGDPLLEGPVASPFYHESRQGLL
jgi:hypothetical protein